MNITLRMINEDNWRECIALKVRDDQERFVATNINGLALAYAHKEMEPRGIYADETMVGFLMYARDPDDGVLYINRLMIDEKFQNNGYGEKATNILLAELDNGENEFIDILHKPDNYSAIKIYRRLGFEETDMTEGDEVVSRLYFKNFKK
ncbi:MAG TPA: GNAT family N-acetyltransferase [Ignavibacteria bacterium]|nr:N-acetyltransferase [Bacteroidota bacterium]HRI86464.1 GNAT family N-acetyltransferase [Ignavibacteria bacterium]HRK00267.1 GNAT family N-acetyltransferase [Ignavibacteria bacterium]